MDEPLFTTEPISFEDLCARQGITGPQGLDAFVDHEWPIDEDERSRLFLEVTLGVAAASQLDLGPP